MLLCFIECLRPKLSHNVKIKNDGPIMCASVFEVECEPGFHLQGERFAFCLADYNTYYFWNGEIPTCT